MDGELFGLSEVRRPPLRYHGGKFRMAPWIIPQIPPHECYVEPFGGGAGLLLRKTRSKIEVWNDLDDQVVAFFRVLRDPAQRDELVRLLALTPFSRREFEEAYTGSDNPVEAARQLVVRCGMGHGTCSIDPRDSNGFRSSDVQSGKSYAREWAGIPDAIVQAAERFMGVTIEHLDWRRLIPKFDRPETFFFVDPPYMLETRQTGGKGYVHELSVDDHRQLAWMLRQIQGKAMVCGYPSSRYDDLYHGWHRREKKTTANGQRGAVPRTECIWTNFPPEEKPRQKRRRAL